MRMADNLSKRLADAEALGLDICGEAKRALAERDAEIKRLTERHAESRADCLAVAYAKLRDGVASLLSSVRYAASEDGDLEDLEEAERKCRAILDASPADEIGRQIVRAAAEAPGLAAALIRQDLAALENAGMAVDYLHELGVTCEASEDHPFGGGEWSKSTLSFTVFGKRGLAAFRALYAKLAEKGRKAA